VATTTPADGPGQLGLLVDGSSGRRFLADCGSVYSILPYDSNEPTSGPALVTANRVPVPCWGKKAAWVKFGGRWFKWRFLRAKVSFPIIGADFLKFFDLLVDLKRMRLVRGDGAWSVPLVPPPPGSTFAALGVARVTGGPPLHIVDHTEESTCGRSMGRDSVAAKAAVDSGPANSRFHAVLQEFPQVLNPSKVLPKVKHRVKHKIITSGPASAARYRRLDPAKLKAAKEEFSQLEKQGIVRRSSSQWASPLHMVKKPDGSWRPCGDFRLLNGATQPDRYTCPNLGDLTARLDSCKVFSKLDL